MPPEKGGDIPAIALTAYAGEINQKKALAAGFQMHLAKPIELAELLKVTAQILASRNREQERRQVEMYLATQQSN